MKRDYLFVFAKLSVEIDLLARLEHADRIENLLRWRRRRAEGRQCERQRNNEYRISNLETMTKSECREKSASCIHHLSIRVSFVLGHWCFVIYRICLLEGSD